MCVQKIKLSYNHFKLDEHSKVILSTIPTEWKIMHLDSTTTFITSNASPTPETDQFITNDTLFLKIEYISENESVDRVIAGHEQEVKLKRGLMR